MLHEKQFRERVDALLPECLKSSKSFEADLHRHLKSSHRTHLLATERLTSGAPKLMEHLGMRCSDAPPLTPQHVSIHLNVDDLYTAEEHDAYNAQLPLLTSAHKSVMDSKNGFVADARKPQKHY